MAPNKEQRKGPWVNMRIPGFPSWHCHLQLGSLAQTASPHWSLSIVIHNCLLSSQDCGNTGVRQGPGCLVAAGQVLWDKSTGFVSWYDIDCPILVLFDKVVLCLFVQTRKRRPRGANMLGQLVILMIPLFFLGLWSDGLGFPSRLWHLLADGLGQITLPLSAFHL